MNWKKAAVASIVGAVLAGCGEGDKAATDEVAISVNGEALMQSQIDEDVAKFIEAQGGKIPAEQIDYAKKMIAKDFPTRDETNYVSLNMAVTPIKELAEECEFLPLGADRKCVLA